MKIAAIRKIFNYIGISKVKDKNEPEVSKKVQSSEPVTVSYPAPLINSSFAQRPISSKCPIYEPINCDYSNLDEFSVKFSEKINSQLMTIEIKYIENLILRLQLKTKASPTMTFPCIFTSLM